MKVYKLTDTNDQTRNNTQWGKGVTHEAPDGGELCSDRWIHAYKDPLLAILMNPAHGDIKHPHLWECEAVVGLEEPDKIGCTKLTTIKRIRKPRLTKTQMRKFAILCALEIHDLWSKHDTGGAWKKWADAWLAGKDRSREATWTARAATWTAEEAAWAAVWAAREAAWADKKMDLVKIAHKAVEDE